MCQIHTHPKYTNCSKSAAGFLSSSQQSDISMRSHRLLCVDDNKSAASYQVDSQDFLFLQT